MFQIAPVFPIDFKLALTRKVFGENNSLFQNKQKVTNSVAVPLFSILYGWRFAPEFLTSATLSTGGDLRAKYQNSYFVHNIAFVILGR